MYKAETSAMQMNFVIELSVLQSIHIFALKLVCHGEKKI